MHRRRLLILGFLAILSCGALVSAVVAFRSWYAARNIRQAYSAAELCLIGAEPANPEQALRGAELTVAQQREPSSWPQRCGGYIEDARRGVAKMLSQRWGSCGPGTCCDDDEDCFRLERLSFQLAAAAGYAKMGKSSQFDITELHELARALDIAGASLSDGVEQAPVAPPTLLRPAEMTPLYRGDYLRLLTDPGGTRAIDLLFYDHERRYGLCRTSLAQNGKAVCRILPSTIPVGMAGELMASAPDAPPTLYAQGPEEDSWVEGLFDADSGKQLNELQERPIGGFVWDQGHFSLLSEAPPLAQPTLFRSVDGELEAVAAVAADSPLAGPKLLYDRIVWAERAGNDWLNIKVQQLQRSGPPLASAQVIGGLEVPSAKVGFDHCRTDSALAVLSAYIRGDQVAGMLSFHVTGKGWLPPQSILLGARRFGFTCRGDTATFSWIIAKHEQPIDGWVGSFVDGVDAPIRGRYRVHRLRCSAAGCEHREADVKLSRYSRNSRYVAGDVGNAMLVLWRSPQGDVRMKLAQLEDLAEVPDVPLFDDVEHDGFGWDLEGDPIFGRADKVLVLLSRQLGDSDESATYGVVIDDQGEVAPLLQAAPAQ